MSLKKQGHGLFPGEERREYMMNGVGLQEALAVSLGHG